MARVTSRWKTVVLGILRSIHLVWNAVWYHVCMLSGGAWCVECMGGACGRVWVCAGGVEVWVCGVGVEECGCGEGVDHL